MKIINVYSFFLFLGMSFSLLGMEEGQWGPHKSLVSSPQSPVFPRRNDNKAVSHKESSKAKRQISFFDESQEGDEREEKKKEEGTVQFLNNASILPYQYIDILKNEKLNTCAFGTLVCSNQSFIKSMNSAAEQDKEITLKHGSHFKNVEENKFHKKIRVKKNANWHSKTGVGLVYSPSKRMTSSESQGSDVVHGSSHLLADSSLELIQESVVVNGSPNLSNRAWNNKGSNFEAGLKITNNNPLAEKVYYMIKSDSPIKEKKSIIQHTPEKLSAYSSKDIDLNASWALRLRNLAERTGNNRVARLRSMTLNSEEIVDAAIYAAQRGVKVEALFDKAALTGNGEHLIQKMVDGGVNVHIFCSDYGSHKIMHIKDLIIENGGESDEKIKELYINSSGNFTNECDNQINVAMCVPNNKEVITDAIADFERVSAYCISVDEAIKLRDKAKVKVAENKKKKVAPEKKKKEKAEEKKAPAKKRKRASGDEMAKKPAPKKRKK